MLIIENVTWHQESSSGDVARYETGNEDNFTQCGHFYRNVLTAADRERLTDNIAGKSIKTKLELLKKSKQKNTTSNNNKSGSVVLSPARTIPSKI